MFNLERAITNWRRQMLAAGIKSPVPLDELEAHLRDEIEQQVQSGVNEPQAFERAAKQIGQATALDPEFRKVVAAPRKKFFTLRLLPALIPPLRQGADVLAAERIRLQDVFRTNAAESDKNMGLVWAVLSMILLGSFGATIFAFFGRLIPAIFGAVVALAGLCFLAIKRGSVDLVCPGCLNNVEDSRGSYCPECGSHSLQPRRWFRFPHCTGCGKIMSNSRAGRLYKIRACTHCGLRLDDNGV